MADSKPVNGVRGKISIAKLKAVSQEERLQKWKEHFKNLFESYPKTMDKRLKEIRDKQLDIKLGQFVDK